METIETLKEKILNSDLINIKKALDDYNIHEHDKFGNNILHYYLNHAKKIQLNYKDLINSFVNKGLDINEKQIGGPYQRSPLHLAVFLKLKEISDYLIQLGADINSTDANGNTILMTAVMWYRNQDGYFIEKLLANKADKFKKNNYNINAVELANSIANNDVKKFFD